VNDGSNLQYITVNKFAELTANNLARHVDIGGTKYGTVTTVIGDRIWTFVYQPNTVNPAALGQRQWALAAADSVPILL
jgi:hypothetical protein